jgi:hypothetical protein
MEKVLKTWLFQQCRVLPGSISAVMLTGPPDAGPYDRALSWPDDHRDHAMLSAVARAALRNNQAVIKTRNE